CDMAAITADQPGSGALCTPKGRMLANVTLYRAGEQTRLVSHRALAQSLLDTLKKYAVFYKTRLADASGAVRVLGIAGPDDSTLVVEQCAGASGGCGLVALSPGRGLLVVGVERAEAVWTRPAALATSAGVPLWTLLAIRDGQGEVGPVTLEDFIP